MRKINIMIGICLIISTGISSQDLIKKEFIDIGKTKPSIEWQILIVTTLEDNTSRESIRFSFQDYASRSRAIGSIPIEEMADIYTWQEMVYNTPPPVNYTEISITTTSEVQFSAFTRDKNPWQYSIKLRQEIPTASIDLKPAELEVALNIVRKAIESRQ